MAKTDTSAESLVGEFDLIRTYFAPLTKSESGAFNLTDDAAVLALEPGYELVVTTDTIVASVHFLENSSPDSIAAKLLRVNLSDLAAMGATPRSYTLSLALTNEISSDWLAAFANSLARDQINYGITLVGGDTVSTPGPLTLTLTAIGIVPNGQAIRRNNAKVGDDIYVSGTIGDGALGLLAAQSKLSGISNSDLDFLLHRYAYPQCRGELGKNLVGIAHAAADISDGLVADLAQICEPSGVSATISAPLIPLSGAAQSVLTGDPSLLLSRVLTGGDDYELIFTADPSNRGTLIDVSNNINVQISKIGEITSKSTPLVSVLSDDGKPIQLKQTGFHHF
jgi:thiamine-monophosphate kinase